MTMTDELRSHFCKYGRVVDGVVMRKYGRPRGFASVTFDDQDAVERVLSEPQLLDGRVVDVKRAVPEERDAMDKTIEDRSNKVSIGGLPQSITTEGLRGY